MREITYKNVNTLLTSEDLDLPSSAYGFKFLGLTNSLPYRITEKDIGINELLVYLQGEIKKVKVVVTDAFREVDRDGWTIIEPSEDTRIVYVSRSQGDDNQSHPDSMSNLPPGAHYARNIGVKNPDDEPVKSYWSKRRLNPVMSYYDKPEGEASASSSGRDLYAWKAFCGSTGHNGWFAGYRNYGWLQYRFTSPQLILEYVVYNRGSDDPDAAPRDWVFKGSSDGENWTVLDEVSGETGWSRAERREFEIENPDHYEYYRIDVSDDNGANRLHIGELELMGMKKIEVVPVKSLSKAYSLIRSNHHSRDGKDYPDWMLLKRGDSWDSTLAWKKSGPSPDKPIVIAPYGDKENPPPSIERFRIQDSGVGEAKADNWIISGLEIRQGGHLLNVNPDNVLIEDCLLSGSGQFNFQSNGKNQDFRRNVIVDNYSTSSHAQGIYAGGARNLLIEENIFDLNGWNPDVDGAEPTIYNHNIYLSNSSRDARVYRNIVSRGSSYGLQAGGGGWVRDNIFTRNVYHIMAGARIRTNPPGVRAVIEGNVVTEGVSAGSGRNPGNGKGIEVANLNPEFDHIISDNIVFNTADYGAVNSGHGAITTSSFHGQDEVGQKDLLIKNNILYNWPRSLRLNRYDENMTISGNIIQQPSDKFSLNYLVNLGADIKEYSFSGNTWYAFNEKHSWFRNGNNMTYSEWKDFSKESNPKWEKVDFFDSQRNLASYNATLGEEESFEAFIYTARQQSRHNWTWDYHPINILDSFREG
ncbi:MAG: right-handed parallel beta-helix repeat-containing protein, partial [Elusimicrobiota bacterium]